MILGVFLIIGAIVWSLASIKIPPTKERHSAEKQKLIKATNRYYSELMRNINRASMRNNYGTMVNDKREKVFIDFFKNIKLNVDVIDYPEAGKIVVAEIDARRKRDKAKGFNIKSLPTNGHEFEHWVADGLNKFGWSARVTQASGDQGIDVIARKKGKTIGLQCKLFSTSVGNKAVQEAFAGKTFHRIDAVGVITNSYYTDSAKNLASDTGVKLLSHHDIPNLYEKMFNG